MRKSTSLIAVFVIGLGGLVGDWVECRAIANVQFNGRRQTKFDNADAYSISNQPTLLDDSATNLSLENARTGRRPSTRESAPRFDSSTKTDSTDYELAFKNASADNVLPNAVIRKIVSILGKKAAPASTSAPAATITGEPNKQLFGGRLPPFIERIIQRIQNYFSVYNPPEYFDGNRPPPPPPPSPSAAQQHAAITLICTNTTGGSVSCSETNSSEEQQEEEEDAAALGETLEMCDGGGGGGQEENSADVVGSPQDEYNVVVTHTIVQDSSLNVYAPPAPAPVPFVEANAAANVDSTHMFSNVVVILEPVAGQYSPPPLDNADKKKFYVNVNPTAAAANKDQHQQPPPQRLKTWNESAAEGEEDASALSNYQPFANATYTVIIRGDKLQEYNNDLQTADNNSYSLNPKIAIYLRNSTTKKLKKCKLPLQPAEDCGGDQGAAVAAVADVSLTSRSVSSPIKNASITTDANDENDDDDNNDVAGHETKAAITDDNENFNKVPNINLMLVPPNGQPSKSKNRSCASQNKVTKNPQLEYYVLKPDNGSLNKGKTGGGGDDDQQKATFSLHKTSIGAATLSQSYLPPPGPSSSSTTTRN